VQQELGREWLAGRLSVAEEHAATAVTQTVMSRLHPWVLGADRGGKVLVAACVGDEMHELGIRMVADFFEMGGWNAHYLGADVPTAAIVSYVAEVEADLVALSATIAFHVERSAEVVSALRADPKTRAVKVIVGGYPFNRSKGLWSRIGADGCAHDATAAFRLGERLTSPAT
jgi:methanogenic corrinoid protein MtbC1